MADLTMNAFRVPEQYRITKGQMATDASFGNNGVFFVPSRPGKAPFRVIASDGEGWEHVSVSLPDRCPTWGEMCSIKAMFWSDETTVMQLHPPRSQWVSNHAYCLHLWRPIGQDIPAPPSWMVGYKELGELHS